MSAAPAAIITKRGSAAELHALEPPVSDSRELWVLDATRPAVVLGSSQSEPDGLAVWAEARGLDVARRRSGGGAVLVDPAQTIWLDLLLPAADSAHHDDLGAMFCAVGDVIATTLRSCGLDEHGPVTVHRTRPGPEERDRDSLARRICFAGLGWGEVLIGPHKAVGLSQRRTRWGARVQVLVDLVGVNAVLADVFAQTHAELALIETRQRPAKSHRPPPDLNSRLEQALATI